MADWLEIAANIATGGIYEVAKTGYEASEAAQSIGQTVSDEVERVADEAASAIDKLFRSVNTAAFEIADITKGIDELLKVDRPDGRTDAELRPDELRLKNAFQALLTFLQARAQSVQNSIDYLKTHGGAPDRILDLEKDLETTKQKITMLQQRIAEITYQEPGAVTLAADFIEQSVERFNSLEQPRLETIMDSANGGLVQAEGLVRDIRQLLWIRQALPQSSLTGEAQAQVERYRQDAENYGLLADRSADLGRRFAEELARNDPAQSSSPKPKLATTLGNGNEPSSVVPSQPGPELPAEPERSDALEQSKDGQPLGRASLARLVWNLNQQNFIAERQRYYQNRQREAEEAIRRGYSSEGQVPGVLTAAIDGARKSIERFNGEEQPRIERLLDGVTQNLLESQKAVRETQAAIAQVRLILTYLHSLITNQWVKIGAMVFAGLFGLILLFGVIALFRLAFRV